MLILIAFMVHNLDVALLQMMFLALICEIFGSYDFEEFWIMFFVVWKISSVCSLGIVEMLIKHRQKLFFEYFSNSCFIPRIFSKLN